MKIVKSRSGRKIQLYDSRVNRDYGTKYQRELIESYDLAKGESFFRVFSRFVIYCFVAFLLLALGRYVF